MQVRLNDWQNKVWFDQHRFRIVSAGRRSGKSVLSQLTIIHWAIQNEGLYWIVCPTYRQAKQIHWDSIRHFIPQGEIQNKNETELSITLRNGSIIELRGSENPDSLRGVKIRGLVVDEIASIRNWDWLYSEVLRPTLTDYESPALFISTPKGYNHFYDLFTLGQSDEGDYKSWRFTSYDNPYISKEEIDAAKKDLTEDTFAQEYLADFRKFTGLVYKEFEREVHVIEPFDIPESWTMYRGMDFGSTNPTACLWIAVDGDENWFIVCEHYDSGKTIDYHAGQINASPFSRAVAQTFGDPSGAQIITEFSTRGIYITPATKETGTNFNSWVRFGIEKVAERLKPVPGHKIERVGDRPQGLPSLYVFSSCTNTIHEFETYRWKEKSVTQAQDLNEPDVPEKANDHCFTGETMILTKTGWKRIDTIEKGEYVWSPFGWNEVYRAGCTGKKKVKDYGVFRCTPDHRILTARGLVVVDKLRNSDRIMIWLNTRPYTFREFLTAVIQTPRIELIGFIFNALLTKSLEARRAFYIEKYGNTIGAKFLTAIWFIILTGILVTTTLATLGLSLLVTMLRNITGVFGRGQKSIWRRLDRLQRRGITRWLVDIGIANMGSLLGETDPLLRECVKYAEKHIKRPFPIEAGTVIKTAKQRHCGERKVYNLATRFGMYFANGILVSNSMDALRYFAVSYRKHTESRPAPIYKPADNVIGI